MPTPALSHLITFSEVTLDFHTFSAITMEISALTVHNKQSFHAQNAFFHSAVTLEWTLNVFIPNLSRRNPYAYYRAVDLRHAGAAWHLVPEVRQCRTWHPAATFRQPRPKPDATTGQLQLH